MKKLIAILAMIALVGGVAFAEAAVGGHVIGTVNLLEGSDAKDSDITGSAGLNRVRIEASGGDEEGKFGAWVRFQGAGNYGREWMPWEAANGNGVDFWGNAWWKPIDQFLLRVGSNGGDGYYGKEGVTGWMFYQTVSDTGVVSPGNCWGGSYGDDSVIFRSAFYGGYGDNGLMLEIKPAEVFGLNIVLPYFNKTVSVDKDGVPIPSFDSFKREGVAYQDSKVEDIFKALVLQADVNLDFGNIALTYTGDASDATNGKVFLYVGIGAIENVALDIGLGLTLAGDAEGHPIAVGLGAKVDISETFGLKARVVASLGGDKEKPAGNGGATDIKFDVLPFFALSDSMTVFVSVGLAMKAPDEGDTLTAFHFNPYLQVGSEWGPKFLAGIKVAQGYKSGDDAAPIVFSVPIAVNVGF